MSLATLRTALLEGFLHKLDQLAPAASDAPHLQTGRRGEIAAFFYLRRMGYVIVARDWKSARSPGDIDLIAWEGDILCFIEVKTRSSRDVATAEAAIDKHKRQVLRRLAGHYRRQLPESTPARFDVLSIYYASQPASASKTERSPQIELYRNAFSWAEEENWRGN